MSLASSPLLRVLATTALIVALPGCNNAPVDGPAQAALDALVASCTRHLAAREPVVRPGTAAEWTKTGYSPAQVQGEVKPTGSPVTPYVGKIVIKDNEARATAPSEAAAQAVTLTPAHLLSNRTHTFIYSFDGKQWAWQNGQRLTKIPGHSDATEPLTRADVDGTGPQGFAPCLPR
ncbi:hypothetical protein [Acidovorax sp.]|uniref:hypothetical protein n=1 Tax=Acidovorax sp. TaxID=1872122 RepID=UPI00391F6A32